MRAVRCLALTRLSHRTCRRPTAKKSKSAYVNVRIADLAGKTVQYALEEYKYQDKNGKECKYTYGDLKYDINCAYLQDPRGDDVIESDWTPKVCDYACWSKHRTRPLTRCQTGHFGTA